MKASRFFRMGAGLSGFLLGIGVFAFSTQTPVDIPAQYRLYLKALTFDRAFLSKAGNELVIGILYDQSMSLSKEVKDEFIKAFIRGPYYFEGRRLRLVSFGMINGTGLEAALVKTNVDVLYIAPLLGFNIETVSQTCQKHGISTVTGVIGYVESGIAVGFEWNGSKPGLIINLKSARAEGADFSSALLNMARILGPWNGSGDR